MKIAIVAKDKKGNVIDWVYCNNANDMQGAIDLLLNKETIQRYEENEIELSLEIVKGYIKEDMEQ